VSRRAITPFLSIILPVLDEAALLDDRLAALEVYRRRGAEILVVDGGSRDGTPVIARPAVDRVLE
jgi:glycosyltransferase involved in cell wall biosynthesis